MPYKQGFSPYKLNKSGSSALDKFKKSKSNSVSVPKKQIGFGSKIDDKIKKVSSGLGSKKCNCDLDFCFNCNCDKKKIIILLVVILISLLFLGLGMGFVYFQFIKKDVISIIVEKYPEDMKYPRI